jgi:hypothetical protein
MADEKKAPEKELGGKDFSNRVEAGPTTPPPPPEDMFNVEGRDPNFHYHWAEENPKRLQELKRKGYEVCQESSSSAAKGKEGSQRKFLERALNDPKISKADATVAKELLDKMDAGKMDTLINIPSHVLVRTPVANRRRIMEERAKKSKQIEDRIQQDIHDLDKALKRSGKGGMKAFRELFDSIR